jgi:16S rRNA (cytosine1407-C5)-methyltransferase
VNPFVGISGVYIYDRAYEFAIKGTDAFYQGRIYLQSLSSMFPVLALHPEAGFRVLDVCAAPGSKTTQLAMMMQNQGSITALEQNQIRFDKLNYNIALQGAEIVQSKKIDALKFFEKNTEDLYDAILLDVPCSAEGRIHIDNEKTYGFWSLENIQKKAELQYTLLSGALKHLKSGGTLVYSTCTLAPEENEGVIARVLSEHMDIALEDIDIGLGDQAWWQTGLTSFREEYYGEIMKKAVRILPSNETEGFFMVKISKP